MKSLKKVFLARRTKPYLQYKDKLLEEYLHYKLRKKRYKIKKKKNKKETEVERKERERIRYYRPIKELKYLHIAKAIGLTYKQVRSRIDKMVKSGRLDRYTTGTNYTKNGNYYRCKD